jgi:hypothetical protein
LSDNATEASHERDALKQEKYEWLKNFKEAESGRNKDFQAQLDTAKDAETKAKDEVEELHKQAVNVSYHGSFQAADVPRLEKKRTL